MVFFLTISYLNTGLTILITFTMRQDDAYTSFLSRLPFYFSLTIFVTFLLHLPLPQCLTDEARIRG